MKWALRLLILVTGLLAVACGGGGGGGTPPPPSATPPSIASFVATPATITAGQSSTLSWSASGAASLSINNGVGEVTGLNNKVVSPAATTSYVLTATNSGGSVTASTTVTVNPVVAVSLSPATVTLQVGVTQQFTATVTGTTNTAVTWSATGGSITATGLYTAPSAAGTCTVQATSVTDPTKSATATVTVNALPIPVISSFAASPETITAGQSSTLSWSVSGAASLSINNGVGDVTGLNNKLVSPAATTSYVLTATNGGGSATAPTTVTVNPVVAVSLSPATATLQVVGTQQFTATVTGTTNTAVTWSATGGSITATGLYTAPSTAGSYAVQATSVADPTKSATATVTVNADPDFSLSITPPASITAGSTGLATVTASRYGGHDATISLSLGSNPQNITGSGTIPPGQNSALQLTGLTLSVPGSVPSASYPLTLQGTDGILSRTCAFSLSVTAPPLVNMSLSPAAATLQTGVMQQFTATVTGTTNTAVTWSVVESGGGNVTSSGLYTAPNTAGTYHVVATSVADSSKSASATVTVSATTPPYPVGLSDATIQVGGVTRDFRVHVPTSLPSPPKAIVLVLHGGGGEGLDVANTGAHPLSVFRTVADREGFVVVYPGGLPAKDGKPGWDDCRGDNLMASGAEDLGFLDALIARVRGEYGLPIARVFMSGGSNGAQMTLSYALTRSSNIGAVATSNGNLPLTPKPGACSTGPSQPVPILMTHGSADTQMPYGGGCVANIGGACNRGRVISAEATRDAWLAANGLVGVTPTQTVIDLDTTDGGPANRFVYAGTAPVEWWRLDGAGHTVASRIVLKDPNPLTGIQNRDVEFAEIAWAFFKARLPQSAPPPSPQAIQAARDYTFACGGQSFLVMHNGTVLDEAYANGGGADRPQLLASATKGFTGMIGAIAASEGLFDLEEPVAQRALVEWQADPQKSRITYRHLLTMTSGLVELNDLAGWLDYLRAPVAFPAGSTFVYSGDPNIFGLALERRLGGEAVVDYFHRKLFQPLGITSIRWGSNFQDGHPQLSGGAYVTARDWARFGEFVHRTMDGSWTGPSLLAKPFFDRVFTGGSAHPAYGFYWWLKEPVPADLAAVIDANNKGQYTRDIKPIVDDPRIPDDFVMAAGAYDQRLYVIPSLGLTVVRHGPTGLNAFEDVQFLDRLLGGSSP